MRCINTETFTGKQFGVIIKKIKMRSIKVSVLTLMVVVLSVGCVKTTIKQNSYEQALVGKWAYTHDLKKTVANFKTDSNAYFEGKKYTYSSDGAFISQIGRKRQTND